MKGSERVRLYKIWGKERKKEKERVCEKLEEEKERRTKKRI